METQRINLDRDCWIDIKRYLKSLPENPSKEDLEKVLYIAKGHEIWMNRREAVNILGRTGYAIDELLRIASTDDFILVRSQAERWITDYPTEIMKYKSENQDI